MVWGTDQGIGGPCVGLIDWSTGPIALAVGPNVISVSATDRMHNTGSTQLIVTYTPTPSEPQPDPDSDEPPESQPDEPEETIDQDDPEPVGSDSPETGDDDPPPPQVDQEPPVSSGNTDDANEADEAISLQPGRVVGSGTCGSLGTVAWCFTLLGMSMLRPRFDRRLRRPDPTP